ncbi:MAG: class I SAM-dependent rRNA methyltransferase [Gemmatimonadetes bacterium]|nr:class I SAM-dependent rRNA methyltransferase [Gemmatimonadota bacterium]
MNDTARVSARGASRWARGHPWIYRSDILELPACRAGAVRVLDERGGLVGTALWSPASTISLRMLTHDDVDLGPAFWHERLEAALAYRRRLGLGEATGPSAYRLVHAEADGLPSLVVDRYGEVLVAQFLSAGLERYREEIVQALDALLRPAGVLARDDVPVREHEGLPRRVELLRGFVPEEVEVREGAVRYLAAPWSGQKTGAFLDQRENRERAGELSFGHALDCFSYHGSFALQLAVRAESVVAVDSSAEALARAEANARLNGFAHVRVREGNVFDFLRDEEAAGARYDMIVLDPPAFAKRRSAVERALRGYKEINLRALRLLAPGGTLCTFSCSYHVGRDLFSRMLQSAAADAGRTVRWIEARGQAADHPEIVQIPETGYLKGAILQAV